MSCPLVEGEYHYGLHNYTGPGTRIDLFPNAPPVNDIDNVSRIHDLDYLATNSLKNPVARALAVQAADKKAINGYSKYPDEDGYAPAIVGIATKYLAEQALSKKNGRPTVLYPK